MLTRRRGLVRAVLRCGFLTVVAGAAWCAYDVASALPALAAEEPPAAARDATDSILDPGALALAPDPPAPEDVPPGPPQATDLPVAGPIRPPSADDRPVRPEPAPPTGDAPTELPGPSVPTAPPHQALPGDHAEIPVDAGSAERSELTPIVDLLAPVLDVLEPVVGLPQPVPIPTEPAPQPDPNPAAPPLPGVGPVPPDLSDPADLDPDTARTARFADHVIRHRASRRPVAPPQVTGALADRGQQHERDRRVERAPDQPPLSTAPGSSGVDKVPTPHHGPADTDAASWSPPPVSGRVTRPVRDRHRPSRSPRPRSRPA
ncbi:hypothetical protein [Micromonospora lutea]|uniref:hypothetical protein n=1 Tax=Micromonospora lutea TaxID=419825 RepID=UPI00194E5CF0|nr:hypothetical protein [Micromonospora lutea]